MTGVATFSIGARMRAARHLAGLGGVPALARKLKERGSTRGLGATKLYAIEQGRLAAEYRDLAEIAAACGVDVAFFTADLTRLPEISENPRVVIAREIAAAAERARARREGRNADFQPPHAASQ